MAVPGDRGAVRRLADRSVVVQGLRTAVGPHRGAFAALALLAVVAGILDTLLLYAVGRVAVMMTSGDEQAVVGAGPLEVVLGFDELLAAAGVVLVAVVAVNLPLARLTARICRDTLLRQRGRLMDAYLHASWAHRSLKPEGHLQEITMSYCHVTESVVLQLATVAVAVAGLVALAVAAVVIAGWVAVVAFVGLVALGLVLRPLAASVKRNASSYADLNRDYASVVAQTARLSPEIATFDVADAVVAQRREEAAAAGRALEHVRFTTKLTPVLFQYGALGVVVAMIWALTALELGDLALIGPLILLLVRALTYARQLQQSAQTMIHYSPYVEKLEEEIRDLEAHRAPAGGTSLHRLAAVRFDDVDFEYLPGLPVLAGVDLEIRPGEAVGVVGPSGGGKSTLTQLLLRLRRPTRGRILVGEVPLDDVDPRSWATMVAVVPQDNKLLRGSVAGNIRFHRSGFADADVERAARAAHLHDEILALPDGYATEIGPGATELSGGQRQRLGIARALIGRPQLLVLDEPTSALDERSELLIRQTLEDLRGTTTLVVVAHRPATLEICDRVVRVAERRVDTSTGAAAS